jgi:hypothetical protein
MSMTIQSVRPEPKTLQSNIISRMLGPVKYQSFLGNYRKNRKSLRMNREDWLSQPLTAKEHTFMYDYLNELGSSITELGRKQEMKPAGVHAQALRICARYLFQNKDKITR